MHLFPVKFILAASVMLFLTGSAYSQSGRRGQTIASPVPTPEIVEPKTPVATSTPPVTAQKNEDYRCTDDGSLARILESEPEEKVETRKLDTPAQILSKPQPSYTREARRNGVEGQVILKVVLSSEGKISRIRIHRGLPAGLTENAIQAACKIKFKPAMNAGQAVSRWVTVVYVFRLAQSSIFSR